MSTTRTANKAQVLNEYIEDEAGPVSDDVRAETKQRLQAPSAVSAQSVIDRHTTARTAAIER